jgi:hypothetical protein
MGKIELIEQQIAALSPTRTTAFCAPIRAIRRCI